MKKTLGYKFMLPCINFETWTLHYPIISFVIIRNLKFFLKPTVSKSKVIYSEVKVKKEHFFLNFTNFNWDNFSASSINLQPTFFKDVILWLDLTESANRIPRGSDIWDTLWKNTNPIGIRATRTSHVYLFNSHGTCTEKTLLVFFLHDGCCIQHRFSEFSFSSYLYYILSVKEESLLDSILSHCQSCFIEFF